MDQRDPMRMYGLEKNRLEALADGIFAVALTLLVLDIKLPDSWTPATSDELAKNLFALERHFVIYVISFLVIGMHWIDHHLQFHFVKRTNRGLIWINLLYLLLVSFLPFATDLVGDHRELVLPCEIYGVALLALSGTSLLHIHYLLRHPSLASSELTPGVCLMIKRRIKMFAIVPVLSMIVAFYSTHLAVYAYLLLALVHFFPGPIEERLVTAQKERLPI